MKKAFVFDLFGTLVNVFEKQVYNSLIEEMSNTLNIDYEDFYKFWNIDTYDERMIGKYNNIYENIESILEKNNLVRLDKDILNAVKIRSIFVKKSMELHRECLFDTLANIKERGFKIGLISDCSPDVPEVWDSLKYSKYFDSVIFSCEVGMKKPDPKIYQKSVQGLNVSFDECYYIGDGGSNELTGAHSVGMHSILIKSEADEKKDVHKKYVDPWTGERIFCLSELMDYK